MRKAFTEQNRHETEEPQWLNRNRGLAERWTDISIIFTD